MTTPETPQLQVILPQEMQDQIYYQILQLANKAVEQATSNVEMTRKDYLKEFELRKYLGIGQEVLDRLIKDGHITYTKIGRSKFYSLDDVKSMMEKLKF